MEIVFIDPNTIYSECIIKRKIVKIKDWPNTKKLNITKGAHDSALKSIG